MYTLCTTSESVSTALKVLSAANYIFLDCEGRDLGCAAGALSIISLGAPGSSHVYLFDVLTLPHEALQLLFNAVLSLTPSARSKTKVLWDGRMDYVELFYSYSCPIENVIDLQLVDVLSRSKRGQAHWQQTRRFARKNFPVSELRKLQLEEVHALNGMDSAIREHKITGIEPKNVCIQKLHLDNLSEVWMQRPLSDELLRYAAGDVRRIAAIYDHFLRNGYLEPMDHILQISSLYVSMHKDEGKPDPENIYLKGPYMPLSIPLTLSDLKDKSKALKPYYVCSGCKRRIPERHFPFHDIPKNNKPKPKNNPQGKPRSDWCKICTIILAKNRFAEALKARQDVVELKKVQDAVITQKEQTVSRQMPTTCPPVSSGAR